MEQLWNTMPNKFCSLCCAWLPCLDSLLCIPLFSSLHHYFCYLSHLDYVSPYANFAALAVPITLGNIFSLNFLYVCMVNTIYLLSFVETPRKFIIAELSIRKLGSSSVLIIVLLLVLLLALMKIRAYGSKALQ